MRFESDVTAVLHGFGGYFEAKLYKDIIISALSALSPLRETILRLQRNRFAGERLMLAGIHPETHSPGMFSWFPVYFPIKVRAPLFAFQCAPL